MAARGARGKAEVRLVGGFPAGQQVGLYVRVGDHFTDQKKVASGKVDKDSAVVFRGVEPGSYWAAAEVEEDVRVEDRVEQQKVWRSRAVTAKVPEESDVVPATAADGPVPIVPQKLAKQLQSQTDTEIVTGQRHTGNTRPRDARGHLLPQTPLAHPEEAQMKAPKGAQLASDTHAGAAVPAPVEELQQQDVPDGVQQESSTELGTATPLPGELEKLAKAEGGRSTAAKRDVSAAEAKKRSAAAKKGARTRARKAAAKKSTPRKR